MNERQFIPKFIRLPPPTGVPFSGFEFARIESRATVEEAISRFLSDCRSSRFVNVAFIRAEWGEGKTDAYERYINPTASKYGDYVYLITTSTIIDKVARSDQLFPEESTLAARFLACIFAAIRDELRSRTGGGDPFIGRKNSDALNYIQEVLDFHFSKGNQASRMFIFIDEFEEILGQPSNLQISVISGIKELVNGQVGMIHEGGRYAGRLHLIIACTPYAYNRIKDSVELAETFGSFASRLKLIDLPQLKKFEVYRFIMDLLKYSYGGNLPASLPFASTGILNTIATVSQRNPRAIVQIFCDLMSSADPNSSIRVIDSDLLLGVLKDKEISIYGGSTRCIDSELFASILGHLGGLRTRSQECISLFKLLLGELKPFSLQQIRERLGLSDQDIYACVEAINRELKRVGIQKAIIRYMPLAEGRSFTDVLASLSPTEGEVQLNNSRISVEKLRDEMVYYEFSSRGELLPFVVFPRETEDVEVIFDLDSDDSDWLYGRIARHFEDSAKSQYYMLSPEVVAQIYPSPIWLLIDFIKDRNKRMELWREVVKSRAQLSGLLEEAFVGLVHATGKLRLERKQNYFLLNYEPVPGRITQIPAILYTSTMGLDVNDIKSVRREIGSVDALIAFVVYVGDVAPQAQQDLASIPQALPIHIRPIRAQQLLVEMLARAKGIELNTQLLNQRIREILYEVDITKAFDEWLNKVRQRGIVIDELKKKYGKSDRELAAAYKLFINLSGQEVSLDDVFASYNTLDNFRVYGERSDLTPLDIETKDDLEPFRENLIINGFLERTSTGLMVVRDTPIESRILEMVKNKSLPQETIKRRFVNLSTNEEILNQVYLPILEHKGRVSLEGSVVNWVNRVEAEKETREEYSKFFEQLLSKRNSLWWNFAHICVSKEREDRVITIEDFEDYVRKQTEYLKTVDDDSIFLQRARLIHLLIEHYRTRLEPRINAAVSKADTLNKAARESFFRAQEIVESILERYNTYSKERTYRKEEMTEYDILKKKYEAVENIMKRSYSKSDLLETLEHLRRLSEGKRERLPFFFRKDPESASYYNYKVYALQRAVEDLDTEAQKIISIGTEILGLKDNIDNLSSEIKGKILTLKVSDDLKISSELYRKVAQIKLRPIEAEPAAKLSLQDLRNFFTSAHTSLLLLSKEVGTLVSNLNTLINNERLILNFLREADSALKNLGAFLKGSEYQTKVEQLADQLSQTQTNLNELLKEASETKRNTLEELKLYLPVVLSTTKNLVSALQKLKQDATNIHSELVAYLLDYKNRVERFLVTLGNEQKIHDLRRSFLTLIDEAIHVTEAAWSTQPRNTWSQLLTDLEDFRSKVFGELEGIIPKDESVVLFELVKYLPEKGWIELQEIIKAVSKSLNLKEEDAITIVRRIAQRGLLREGIAYAF